MASSSGKETKSDASAPAVPSKTGKTGGPGQVPSGEIPPHPWAPESKVIAIWRDGTPRRAVVIERAPCRDESGAKDGRWKYYVHYTSFNRRMDEWVGPDRIRWDTGEKLQDAPTPAEAGGKTGGDKKRKAEVVEFVEETHDEHEGMDEASLREHEEVTKVKNINYIQIGKWRIETWYFSPFPKELYPDGVLETLFTCEFCLSFFQRRSELLRHMKRCTLQHPPGNEIYRSNGVAVFEVDGDREKFYSQNLCYIAKLFLDHKTLYYDVDPFLFYVICELDEFGFHVVGYFSKEKYSDLGYNLACILTLPSYQRKGYGRFIIQFSYELSKKEEKVGSPEKPLSDLGLLSYRSYWSWVLLGILKDYPEAEVSVMDLTKRTSIKTDDIITTLQYLNLIRYWNGTHVVCVSKEIIETKFKRLDAKKGPRVDPDRLHWTPLHMYVKRDKWSIRAKKKPDD